MVLHSTLQQAEVCQHSMGAATALLRVVWRPLGEHSHVQGGLWPAPRRTRPSRSQAARPALRADTRSGVMPCKPSRQPRQLKGFQSPLMRVVICTTLHVLCFCHGPQDHKDKLDAP